MLRGKKSKVKLGKMKMPFCLFLLFLVVDGTLKFTVAETKPEVFSVAR